jgi:hypothetical protein
MEHATQAAMTTSNRTPAINQSRGRRMSQTPRTTSPSIAAQQGLEGVAKTLNSGCECCATQFCQGLLQSASLRQLSVTLLGPPIHHRDSLSEMLEGRVANISWIPDSYSFLAGQRSRGVRKRLLRLKDQFAGTSDIDYTSQLVKALDANPHNMVLAYWGTIPLPDLALIKRLRPQVKTVLMMLCYPLALTTLGIHRQQYFLRRSACLLDGVLYPSYEMKEYVQARVFKERPVPSLVLPPCWPTYYQAAFPQWSPDPFPRLVYVGRTDLAHPTIHPADDIRPIMRDLLDAGIELHHAYSPETDDGHPKRKPFLPLHLRELIAQMERYDASLICYNTDACSRDDRFSLTVFDRLLTSVAAGIPIAIPAQGYAAAKSYLKQYPAVLEFRSPADLAEKLAVRSDIERFHRAAWDARRHYTAKSQAGQLERFLGQLL